MMSPADVAAKWAANLAAALPTIKAGVQSVTTAPTSKAAAAVDRWAMGVQRAAADGSFVRGCGRVSLQDWQNAMLTKGSPRIGPGAAAAKPKMEAFLGQWLPYMDQIKSILANQPRGTLDQNIARAVAVMQHNAAFVRH